LRSGNSRITATFVIFCVSPNYLKTAKGIILLTIYTKSEQADIAADELTSIIADYEQYAAREDKDA